MFLFLSPDGATKGILTFTDGPHGAYRIVEGRVTSMTKAMARQDGPEPLGAFESRVLGLIKK